MAAPFPAPFDNPWRFCVCGTALPSAVFGITAHDVALGCTWSAPWHLSMGARTARAMTTATARAMVMCHRGGDGAGAGAVPAEGGKTFACVKEPQAKSDHQKGSLIATRFDGPLPRGLSWQGGLPHAVCLNQVNIGIGGDEKAHLPGACVRPRPGMQAGGLSPPGPSRRRPYF